MRFGPAHPVPRTRQAGRAALAGAAALTLALAAAAAPAAGAPSEGASELSVLGSRADRGSARALPEDRSGIPLDAQRLEASATSRGPGTGVARTPKVLKRQASLWMYRSVDFWPHDALTPGAVAVVQDVKNSRLTASVTFDAVPTADTNGLLWVYLGTWKDSKEETCTGKVWAVAATYGSASDVQLRDKTGLLASGSRSLSGSTLKLTVSNKKLAEQGYTCAFAYVDEIVGETQTQELWSSGAETFKATMEKAPRFSFYSSDLHAAYPKTWNKIRVNVRNDGDKTAKNVKLKVSGKKLRFKSKTIKVGTLKAGKSKSVNVTVKLSGKSTRKLSIKATASGGWTAKTSTKVGYRAKPTKPKSIKGRTYWASFTGSGSDNIWQVRGLAFIDSKWVYVGVPSKGGVPKCSKKVKQCERYTYNRSKGQVKFGKYVGKVNSEGITITKAPKKSDLKKLRFTPLQIPKKGSKIKAKLEYVDGYGQCFSGSCGSWWKNIQLKSNGKFTWTQGRITTIGLPPFQTIVSSSGPDYAGKYKVLSKGRIQFSFRDPKSGKNKKETYTIGIDANALGKYSPKYGLLIGAMPHL